MRKFSFALLGAIVLILMSYGAGYWPTYERLKSSEEEIQELRRQVSDSQLRVRVCALENQLLAVIEQTDSKNYGTAQELSNKFFDNVRAELMQASDPDAKKLLQEVLSTRDVVTTGLARGEADTLQNLRSSLSRFRQYLDRTENKS